MFNSFVCYHLLILLICKSLHLLYMLSHIQQPNKISAHKKPAKANFLRWRRGWRFWRCDNKRGVIINIVPFQLIRIEVETTPRRHRAHTSTSYIYLFINFGLKRFIATIWQLLLATSIFQPSVILTYVFLQIKTMKRTPSKQTMKSKPEEQHKERKNPIDWAQKRASRLIMAPQPRLSAFFSFFFFFLLMYLFFFNSRIQSGDWSSANKPTSIGEDGRQKRSEFFLPTRFDSHLHRARLVRAARKATNHAL